MAVVVLPVHHPAHVAQVATLDYVSNGTAILGVGLGPRSSLHAVPDPSGTSRPSVPERRRAHQGEPRVSYRGSFFQLEGGTMAPKPVQKPHPPLWFGVGHPDATSAALRPWRTDGWAPADRVRRPFRDRSPGLRAELEKAGRDPKSVPISMRVFLSVPERADVAPAELHRWFRVVYHNPDGNDVPGIHGTPEHVRERLEELVAMAPTICVSIPCAATSSS